MSMEKGTGFTPVALSPSQQQFGTNPVKQRETDNYSQEYIKGFVDKWDELIDWESRAAAEGDFFIQTLRKHGVRKVLDVATGTGFHSVRLLEAGFEARQSHQNCMRILAWGLS